MISELKQELGSQGWAKLWSAGFTEDRVRSLLKEKGIDQQKLINIGVLLNASRHQKLALQDSSHISVVQ